MQDIEILIDRNKNGKTIDWKGKKLKTLELAKCYERLGFKKFYRIQECGSFLQYKTISEKEKKLYRANFCKDRLCPLCSWRRSLKIFGQVSKIMDNILENKDCRFLFLTLTIKNCESFELSTKMDELFYAFKKLMLKNKVNKIIKGWFRGLEITHNLNKSSKDYDTYHPHFHLIFMVNKSYFTDTKQYINQKEWSILWKECLNVDYTPIVDIKAFKTSNKNITKKSVAEVAKYTVKDNDYLVEDQLMTDSSVMILNNALKSRRLIAFGKEFRRIHKLLNLSDIEKGDLVNTDNEESIREDLESIIETYKWNIGLKEYIKI